MVMNAVRVSVTTDAGPLLTPDWDDLAAEVGTVFHTSRFLSSWWSDTVARSSGSDLLVLGVQDDSDHIGQCALELRDDELRFAGGGDVVDYMGPIAAAGREAEVAEVLVETICAKLPWRTAVFEGLVGGDQMTGLFVDEFRRRGLAVEERCYDHVPRISPGPTAYLARLNAKRRKEVLRKRSRLLEAMGEVTVRDSAPVDRAATLERLLSWKAQATPATAEFVTRYGGFVRDVVGVLGAAGEAHVVELIGGGRSLASAILFTFRGTHYLYNMSYDPVALAAAASGLAPGVVLVSHLAEQAVELGAEFDFLKGGQDYKLQLGGIPEELVRLTLAR